MKELLVWKHKKQTQMAGTGHFLGIIFKPKELKENHVLCIQENLKYSGD